MLQEHGKAPKQHLVVQSKRDQEMAQQVQEHNKHREKSLLELHQKKQLKKLKKEKKRRDKKEEKEKKRRKEKEKKNKKDRKDKALTVKTERRPFDRDEDLKVNRFDNAMRKNLIKKSAVLNTRFGHGEKQFI